MKLASWNINSIRARGDQLFDWIEANDPDVVCLQETKVTDQEFPEDEFGDLGYDVVYHGQATYNGVAIATKDEASEVIKGLPGEGPAAERRYLALTVRGIRVVTVYVPNGQSLTSDKLDYKIDWLRRLRATLDAGPQPSTPIVVCGDFNIAPEDIDAWDPIALAGHLFLSRLEREAYGRVLAFGLEDAFRHVHPTARQFTWWDYRDAGFNRNEGLRIDHVLVTKPLLGRIADVRIDLDARAEGKASDHAPVLMELGEEERRE